MHNNSKQCTTTRNYLMPHLKIVIDDGSNFIKYAYLNDGQPVLKSFTSRVIRKAMPSPCGSKMSAASYQIDGENYSVSDTGAGSIRTNEKSYQLSNANRVLITHAIKQTGARTVDILLTLPVGEFFMSDGTRNQQLIDLKTANARGDISSLDGEELAEIKGVFVMPEGVPAFSHAKEALGLEDGRYLIADVGGTTTDAVIFDPESNIETFVSFEVGALNMLKDFGQRVSSSHGLPSLTDAQTYNGMVSGVVAGHDVTEHAEHCRKAFETLLLDNVKSLGHFALFDGVIFSGGGSILLKESKNVHVTESPQFDNANGALSAFGGGQ